MQGERAVSSALAGAQLPPSLADLLRGRAPPQAGAPAGRPAPPARRSAPVPPVQQRYRALAFLAHRGGAVATAGSPRWPEAGSAGGGGSGRGIEGGLPGTSRLEFDGASGSVTVQGGSGPAAGTPPAAEGAGSSAANRAAEPAPVRSSLQESPVAAAAAAAAGAADAVARGAQNLQAAAGRAADPNPTSGPATPHGPDLAAPLSPAGAAGSTLEAGLPGGSGAAEEDAKFGVASAFAARAAGSAGVAGAAAPGAGGGAGQMSAPLASPAQQLKQVPPALRAVYAPLLAFSVQAGLPCCQAAAGDVLS